MRGLVVLIWIGAASAATASAAGGAGASGTVQKLVLTADLGTESARVGIFDASGGLVATAQSPYLTTYPQPGWAEQQPADWWVALQQASKEALAKGGVDPLTICGVCIDTTACSVVALDAEKRPLRNCLLWCDARSASQCEEILRVGKGDPSLRVNCDGAGPLSAEWMVPKALWLKQHEPEIWAQAAHVCEKQDYVNWLLTGELVASGCNTAARWHWNGSERPTGLLSKLGLSDLLDKWPQRLVRMGDRVGGLSDASAKLLGGLRPGTPCIQGGPDAYVGMLGLGVLEPKRMALITGSSHLHLCVSQSPLTGEGFWGAYKDAPLAGLCFAEGGQSSTGSLLQWARRLFSGEGGHTGGGGAATAPTPAAPALSLAALDSEAEAVPPGAQGLLCLETFQGSRTPVTDARARGALVGLSLFHTRGHVWRALLEGICLGTRSCISALAAAGLGADELVIGGGAVRSPLFLQLHADVTGLPVVVTEQDNAPLLGCAVLAAAGAGLFPAPSQTLSKSEGDGEEGVGEARAEEARAEETLAAVRRAAAAMVRVRRRVLPDAARAKAYDKLFATYRGLGPLLRDTAHALGSGATEGESKGEGVEEGGSGGGAEGDGVPGRARPVTLVPSLLSADFGHLAAEAASCQALRAAWLHIDVCDGGELAQGALTLGPQAVAAVVRAAPGLKTDVHVCMSRPGTMIKDMAAAGATRLTLQYEQLATPEVLAVGPHAVVAVVSAVCRRVRDAGMACGLVLAPDTPVDVLLPLSDLLDGAEPVIEFVDVLAVQPGVGGQSFDPRALEKLAAIRQMFPLLPHLGIDGGVCEETLAGAVEAGANFCIAGSAVFGKARRRSSGEEGLRQRLQKLRRIASAASAGKERPA